MKKYHLALFLITISVLLVSCAHIPPDRYNTQKGAAIGAGAGALIGQAIGGNTEGTLIGLAAGTILGALVGNAIDQEYDAVRDAAYHGKPVILYDRHGSAVEAIPEGMDKQKNCRRVTKRVWKDGEMISESVEEICEELGPYYYKEPRIVYRYYPYYYPYFPRFHFYWHYSPRHHHRHWHHRHHYHRKHYW